jgi:hypothetical protein
MAGTLKSSSSRSSMRRSRNEAIVEVVPAPGIELASVDGARSEWGEHRSLRIPLGAATRGGNIVKP